jgi:hypothetical protein
MVRYICDGNLTLEMLMSDGPYRTLPMRRRWKDVAERAEKVAFSILDVCDALPSAVAEDWRSEVQDSFVALAKEMVGDSAQQTLFQESPLKQIESLRHVAVTSMERLFVDCLALAAADGLTGRNALSTAAEDALAERAISGSRQIEEHYHRRASERMTTSVRFRLEAAIGQTSLQALGESLLGLSTEPVTRRPPVKNGIDDGVSLK